MELIGVIAVIHARAITKWHCKPAEPFEAPSVIVDFFFQLWAVID